MLGVTFGFLYEQMYDDRRREALIAEVTNAPELGNSQLKEGLLEMMLVMARSDEYIQQLVASEAIIAAASKKKDITAIVNQWL